MHDVPPGGGCRWAIGYISASNQLLISCLQQVRISRTIFRIPSIRSTHQSNPKSTQAKSLNGDALPPRCPTSKAPPLQSRAACRPLRRRGRSTACVTYYAILSTAYRRRNAPTGSPPVASTPSALQTRRSGVPTQQNLQTSSSYIQSNRISGAPKACFKPKTGCSRADRWRHGVVLTVTTLRWSRAEANQFPASSLMCRKRSHKPSPPVNINRRPHRPRPRKQLHRWPRPHAS